MYFVGSVNSNVPSRSSGIGILSIVTQLAFNYSTLIHSMETKYLQRFGGEGLGKGSPNWMYSLLSTHMDVAPETFILVGSIPGNGSKDSHSEDPYLVEELLEIRLHCCFMVCSIFLCSYYSVTLETTTLW